MRTLWRAFRNVLEVVIDVSALIIYWWSSKKLQWPHYCWKANLWFSAGPNSHDEDQDVEEYDRRHSENVRHPLVEGSWSSYLKCVNSCKLPRLTFLRSSGGICSRFLLINNTSAMVGCMSWEQRQKGTCDVRNRVLLSHSGYFSVYAREKLQLIMTCWCESRPRKPLTRDANEVANFEGDRTTSLFGRRHSKV